MEFCTWNPGIQKVFSVRLCLKFIGASKNTPKAPKIMSATSSKLHEIQTITRILHLHVQFLLNCIFVCTVASMTREVQTENNTIRQMSRISSFCGHISRCSRDRDPMWRDAWVAMVTRARRIRAMVKLKYVLQKRG